MGEHKIAGDVVRAQDGAWVPCSCGARMPFPFDSDDRNGEPVTALVIHLQSLVRPATTDEPGLRAMRDRVSAEFVAGGPPLALAGRVLAHIDKLLASTPAASDDCEERVARLTQALRVASHKPHDRDGAQVEGFPTCSGCGAILTTPAASDGSLDVRVLDLRQVRAVIDTLPASMGHGAISRIGVLDVLDDAIRRLSESPSEGKTE